MTSVSTSAATEEKIRGIVTRRDEDHIYVWTSRHPLKEIKFPRWDNSYNGWFTLQTQLGQMVYITVPKCVGEVQDPADIEKIPEGVEPQIEVHPRDQVTARGDFVIRAHFGFPPEGEDYFDKELKAAKVHGCRAIALSFEFGKVALFSDRVDYEPLGLYTGFVSRIPPERDWIAQQLGTLFTISDHAPLEKITDSARVETVRQRMVGKLPWKEHYIDRSQLRMASLIEEKKGGMSLTGNDDIWSEPSSTALARQPPDEAVATDAGKEAASSRCQLPDWMATFSPSEQPTQQMTEASPSQQLQQDLAIGGEHSDVERLLASKLQWVQEHDPSAAISLQESILELCEAALAGVEGGKKPSGKP